MKILVQNLCPHSQWPCWHHVSRVNYYKDFSDTLSAWSRTALKPRQHSQQLHGHGVWHSQSLSQHVSSTTNGTLCQRSQQLLWHMVNYFTLEKDKTKDEKNITWYFLKLLVPRIVIDYALTCWNSRWQRRHDVAIVIDYADKMSVYSLSTVRGHRVRV